MLRKNISVILVFASLAAIPDAKPASAESPPSAIHDPGFSISNIRAGLTSDVTDVAGSNTQQGGYGPQGLAVVKSASGVLAIVDRSMLDHGVTSAATPTFVDLSWDPLSAATQYEIKRNGKTISQLPVGASKFRDTSIVGGSTYRYSIVPITNDVSDPKAKMWSMKVKVPSAPVKGDNISSSLQRQAASQAIAAAVAQTSTVTWETFIPESRIDAPPIGCDYGTAYQFGGDGRGYDWTSSSYRTVVNAVVDWNSKTVDGYTAVGPTTVYRKSDGALVDQRTANNKSYARKMSSGSNYIAVRLVTYSSNPFCNVGAIEGAFSINLTQSGNYSIISGTHRQMPNHHVYIYDGGQVTDVYKRNAASPACLVGPILCPQASFYGRGSF